MKARFRQVGWALFGASVAVLVLMLVGALETTSTTVTAIRESQESNVQARESSDKVLEAIQSCTTPGEKCFRESQRRTAEVVSSINDVTVLAAVCAANLDPPTIDQIESCIRSNLKAVRPDRAQSE